LAIATLSLIYAARHELLLQAEVLSVLVGAMVALAARFLARCWKAAC
jgi:hypothetical protein